MNNLGNRHSSVAGSHVGGRWTKLGYCRETNIHFNRRLPVGPPDAATASNATSRATSPQGTPDLLLDGKQIGDSLNALTLRPRDEVPKNSANKLLRLDQERRANSPERVSLDLESFRQSLVSQVEKHPFWSNKAARRMQLTKVEQRRIYIYELVSYCQRRDLEWRYEPFKGGLVAGSMPYRCIEPALTSISQPSTPDRASAPIRRSSLGRTMSTLCSTASAKSDLKSPLSRVGSTGGSQVYAPSSLRTNSTLSSTSQTDTIERPAVSAELVWSIQTPINIQPAPFSGHSYSCEIPQSSFVKRCHGCSGRGRIKCNTCHGVGYEVCLSCSGKGTTKTLSRLSSPLSANDNCSYRRATSDLGNDNDPDQSTRDSNSRANADSGWPSNSAWSSTTESCHFCHGAGQKRCWVCAGKSYNHCSACAGAGRLRCYLNLNITWLNHRDECILNNSDSIIPRDRLRLCSGLQILDETGEPQLRPLDRGRLDGATKHLDEVEHLRAASKRLRDKHRHAYRDERFLKQVRIKALVKALSSYWRAN